MHDLNPDRDKTIRDFGDQWTRFTENVGRYASLEQFEDIVSPFLTRADFAGRHCADIGSGTGRIVRAMLAAGASHVTAVEPSQAFDVLLRNTADFDDKVTCLKIRGDEIPANDYDVIVSIGVIHHIPDPKPVLTAAFRALRPGGKLLVWVYGHEGNRLYQAIFRPLRMITRRLPLSTNEAIAAFIYPITIGYGRLTCIFPILPLSKYFKEVYLRFDSNIRKLVIVDQINPQWAKYYQRAEIEALLLESGFQDVQSHNRHGYSWTAIGIRPLKL